MQGYLSLLGKVWQAHNLLFACSNRFTSVPDAIFSAILFAPKHLAVDCLAWNVDRAIRTCASTHFSMEDLPAVQAIADVARVWARQHVPPVR